MCREVKPAAFAELTFYPDVPSHEGNEPGRDRQAQTRAAILPGGRRVRLCKCREDQLLFIDWYAHTSVAHHEMQAEIIAGATIYRNVNADLPTVRELDCIAKKICRDLAHTCRVAHHKLGNLR